MIGRTLLLFSVLFFISNSCEGFNKYPTYKIKHDINVVKLLGNWYDFASFGDTDSGVCKKLELKYNNDGQITVTSQRILFLDNQNTYNRIRTPYVQKDFGEFRNPHRFIETDGELDIKFSKQIDVYSDKSVADKIKPFKPLKEFPLTVVDTDYVSYLIVYNCQDYFSLFGGKWITGIVYTRKPYNFMTKEEVTKMKFLLDEIARAKMSVSFNEKFTVRDESTFPNNCYKKELAGNNWSAQPWLEFKGNAVDPDDLHHAAHHDHKSDLGNHHHHGSHDHHKSGPQDHHNNDHHKNSPHDDHKGGPHEPNKKF